MSPPSRKQTRKQKKQRDRKQRKAKSQARSQPSFPPSPRIPELPRLTPRSKPNPETLSPIDRWWDEYSDADGHGRLQMVREKLATVSPDEDGFESLFPEAIMELESKLPESDYVAFLEQLRDEHPAVFEIALDWNTQSLVSHYVAENRMEDVDRATEYLAGRMEHVSDPFFSLLSMIRLAGRANAAQMLIDAAAPSFHKSDLTYSAVNELVEWAMHAPVQACLEAGATEEAIEIAYQKSLALGVNDTEANRKIQRNSITLLAGISKKAWIREELLTLDKEEAGSQVYLLLFAYAHWLVQARGFAPVVADELRLIQAETIDRLECRPGVLLLGLKQKDFEPALARSLNMFSLKPFHAPAAVVAMRHFYDFLHAHDLVDKRTCDTAHDVCYVLWKKLKKAMAKDWDKCRFLEAYLPSSMTTTG